MRWKIDQKTSEISQLRKDIAKESLRLDKLSKTRPLNRRDTYELDRMNSTLQTTTRDRDDLEIKLREYVKQHPEDPLGYQAKAPSTLQKIETKLAKTFIPGYQSKFDIASAQKKTIEAMKLKLKSYQKGGSIKDTGMALLHKGERVLSVEQNKKFEEIIKSLK